MLCSIAPIEAIVCGNAVIQKNLEKADDILFCDFPGEYMIQLKYKVLSSIRSFKMKRQKEKDTANS